MTLEAPFCGPAVRVEQIPERRGPEAEVAVLARAVHAPKGLLVQERRKAKVQSHLLEDCHQQHVRLGVPRRVGKAADDLLSSGVARHTPRGPPSNERPCTSCVSEATRRVTRRGCVVLETSVIATTRSLSPSYLERRFSPLGVRLSLTSLARRAQEALLSPPPTCVEGTKDPADDLVLARRRLPVRHLERDADGPALGPDGLETARHARAHGRVAEVEDRGRVLERGRADERPPAEPEVRPSRRERTWHEVKLLLQTQLQRHASARRARDRVDLGKHVLSEGLSPLCEGYKAQ